MKILYLLQDFPHPPTNGVHLTPHNLIKYMARHHQCHVIAFGNDIAQARIEEWESRVPGLRVLGVYDLNTGLGLAFQRLRAALNGSPLSMARWASGGFREALREVAVGGSYDVVHVDMINLTQYLSDLTDLPVVCSFNDTSSRLHPQITALAASRMAAFAWQLRGRRLRVVEAREAERATTVRLVSEVDAKYLRQLAPGANVEVIGVAVDEALFRLPLAGERPGRPVIFSAGHLSTELNAASMVRFIEEELPRVREQVANAELHVVSHRPAATLVRAASKAEGVTLSSWVEDYPATLAQCTVALFLDTAGTGMKNRVVQAMAAARPVVATPVAFESVPMEHERSGLVCQSVHEAADYVALVLGQPTTQRRLGENGRKVAKEHFHPEVVGPRWELLYRRTIGRHRSSRGTIGNFEGRPLQA